MASEAAALDLVARVKAERGEQPTSEGEAVRALPRAHGGGRPAVGPLVQVRMPVEMIERLQAVAASEGSSLSSVVRDCCAAELLSRDHPADADIRERSQLTARAH